MARGRGGGCSQDWGSLSDSMTYLVYEESFPPADHSLNA